MKKVLFLMSLVLIVQIRLQADVKVASPDGKIVTTIKTGGEQLSYDVSCDGQILMQNNTLGLKLADGTAIGKNPKFKGTKQSKIDETIRPLFPLKKQAVENKCNVATLTFKGNYSVQFRVYNDAVAYRFITAQGKEMTVEDETLTLGLDTAYLTHMQMNRSYHTSSEQVYSHRKVNEVKEEHGVANLPVLINTNKGYKILMSESDQWDYPGMFLKGNGTNELTGAFPPVPSSTGDGQKPYIAKTAGTRSLPWRYFVITRNDGELLECTIATRLAGKCKISDISWIKPGQVSWDWWNGWDVYGPDVDFKSGINTETYKYFIDFASKYGIPYIIIDDGWLAKRNTAYEIREGLDIPELIRYGKEKHVGVMLWFSWTSITNYPDCMEHYAKMGVVGMKIDFMDRHDQEIVNFYERTAQKAADLHLLVDFHGAYKPAGLEYVYPNILSHEGVRGMEQEGGCTPDNTLYEPFIRNVVGPMDYTPGAMISTQPNYFHGSRPNNSSIGTRAYQMALYVLLESNIQMLSDTPSRYLREPDCTEFIASVPVNWDDTRALAAEAGQYEVVAKQKGNRWFLGAITNSTGRNLDVTLDFLPEGRTFTMTAFEDGKNAGYQALHYMKRTYTVKHGDRIKITMARNGGFAAVIQ